LRKKHEERENERSIELVGLFRFQNIPKETAYGTAEGYLWGIKKP